MMSSLLLHRTLEVVQKVQYWPFAWRQQIPITYFIGDGAPLAIVSAVRQGTLVKVDDEKG